MNDHDSQRHHSGSPPAPRPLLWATVLADLRTRLANGEFAERFPTDRELTAHYGVSRHTAREAVRRLDVIDRRPRLGGLVRRPRSSLEQLGTTLRALGVELMLVETALSRRRVRRPAATLGVGPAKDLRVVAQVLVADGQPFLLSELWLPPGSRLEAADVAVLVGLQPPQPEVEVADETVLPALATSAECAALALPDGAAVFCAEQVVTARGKPAAWHRALVRPERYRCIIRWDPSGPL